jgi:NAD(P)-dependent dehydrogenase (short-subunit alcohol dehydrogenase family)
VECGSKLAMASAAQKGDKPVVIVTGANGGIGYEIVLRLLSENYVVNAWDTVRGRLCENKHPNLSISLVDVRNKEEVSSNFQRLYGGAGRIDGLVACAGIYKAIPFFELDESLWDITFDVNLKGAFLVSQAVLPAMRRQRRGSIVLFSSTLARIGSAHGAHYAATKGGILGLARSIALVAAPENVRVNTISPGTTDTAMPRGHSTDADLDAMARTIPLGRIGLPKDMADAALFLLQSDSSFVTGQDLRLNGGALIF